MMKKYRVSLREVWVQAFEVEATAKEEALTKCLRGEGDLLDNCLEYSHTPPQHENILDMVEETD